MMNRVEELRALKDRRSRNREVRDFEERILLDNLEETERQLHGTPNNTYRKQLPLSKHEDLRQLQIEYERMREQERKMIQDLGPLHHRSTGRNSDASMSIHLLKDRSKYNPNNDPKLQSLAENHGKQMEFLSNRNRDLERQRDEIRRRLGDLGRKPPESDNTAALIAELRDQEARNQRLLEELKKQLLASRQPVAIIGEQQQVQQKKSFTYPIYYGNSLVAEISAIRQAYIQSGGDDPEILAQLAQMLAEAQAIEEAMRNKKPPEPKQKEKKTDFSAHIMTLDMENERLNRELYLLQEQNLMAKGRRKDDREVPPITVINYPSRCSHPAPSRATDHIVLETGNSQNNSNSNIDILDSGNCHICYGNQSYSSDYYPDVQHYYPQYAQQQPQYVQQQPQYVQQQPQYVQQQPQYVQQQPQYVQQQPSPSVQQTVQPSIPQTAARSSAHSVQPTVQMTIQPPSLSVPSPSRAPTTAYSVNPATSISGSAREPKSRKSHRSHRQH